MNFLQHFKEIPQEICIRKTFETSAWVSLLTSESTVLGLTDKDGI